MSKKILLSIQFIILSVMIFSTNIYANNTQLKAVSIEDLSWMDKNKMQQQKDKISELAKNKMGMSLHNNWNDIALLQQIIDRKLVTADDSATQEAMGVILGNIMQADFPSHLEWKVYIDSIGRSKALCARGTQECLFPVTMLSRRMKLEMQPNVTEVYDNAIAQIASKLPKMPYGDELLHTLKR
jgi:Domain of unknown function (DUF3806)